MNVRVPDVTRNCNGCGGRATVELVLVGLVVAFCESCAKAASEALAVRR